jgi:FtsP/CotA-like multicopper oxidase with cupredoxin domain
VPGITGPTFDLTAAETRLNQPDGASVYSWAYGCNPRTKPAFLPSVNPLDGQICQNAQVPGPTLIVNQNDVVTITLTNNLPPAAGNTSMLFPGFQVCSGTLDPNTGICSGTPTGVQGLLAREAQTGKTVTYTFVASTPGTHAYYSGTQGDLQIEMGLYGALIVLPTSVAAPHTVVVPQGCRAVASTLPDGQPDYRNAAAAYDHSMACYDREYIFQFSEVDPAIHAQAEQQAGLPCTQPTGCMLVQTEPYHPAYFMINGRSMPDDMDSNYAPQYPNQPYNGNPHMHPGEMVLLRIIGTGRWQHPFHEHGNHVRILARDGNLLLAANDATKLAGPLLFTTTTTPGVAMDGIFYWTGKGLNWDVYAHKPGDGTICVPDANGYYTKDSNPPAPLTAPNYYEWCEDHQKPLEANPTGDVASGGPVTLPDPNILTNGAWYGGSPYLGPDATIRAVGATGTTPPSSLVVNPPSTEAGFAYMWHSHNEREITTNNIFPGGMMMMMLVDPQAFKINESN